MKRERDETASSWNENCKGLVEGVDGKGGGASAGALLMDRLVRIL